MLVWAIITDKERIDLCNIQWNLYHTRLDMFNESQKPLIDHIPEEEDLGKFMSERPHNPAQVV